ncbi:type I-E CRISPR-associated protein Cas6/Cse3/CasE [Bifidobacterium sp. CP2]|uniref:type I-E CRISPR-associated protein Cas6/Cse3/CasE n=1 Tax=Bifidobacterium TaxID=1678 RepID=UPI001BDD2FA5|nr:MULTISPECIES: type I-E CRISPR-associated protein Cas6/Cse3/CasE [Bifidobacterium]MBT1182140.1 type I-E CRISPR-associated protein Cas6/Cse3/CasE [Bifidobacterium sp. CP2]MBW3081503.1 type I-E CRISPR-associated protein Cas6/Cse3/CasE [Bifidobacterium saguinibicoloris]
MFISRVPLNMAREGARQLIASPYRTHAAVESAFPPDAVRDGEEGRILWRLDNLTQDHSIWLYVVSPEAPDLTHIVEQAGWPMHVQWESKDYTPLLSRIAVGQHWQFRLRANPVRRARVDKGRKPKANGEDIVGKLQGHVTVSQQRDWLVSRAETHGFALLSDDNGDPSVIVRQRHRERFTRENQTVTLTTVLFDGRLVVTDADLFRHALCHGVGRAKGFGCGLLTVAPIREPET